MNEFLQTRKYKSASAMIDRLVSWASTMPVSDTFHDPSDGHTIRMRMELQEIHSSWYFTLISMQVSWHESVQGLGLYRRLFSEIEAIDGLGAVLHESVQNPFLPARHLRHGAERVEKGPAQEGSRYTDNYLKIIGAPAPADHPAVMRTQERKPARCTCSGKRGIGGNKCPIHGSGVSASLSRILDPR